MERMIKGQDGKFQKHTNPNLCSIEGCEKPVRGNGFCNMHNLRYTRYGDPHFRKKRANGEGGVSTQGYPTISINGRRIAVHRYLAEQILGRPLASHEIIHHLDGNKMNNELSNLILISRSGHVKLHPTSLENLKLGPSARWGTIS